MPSATYFFSTEKKVSERGTTAPAVQKCRLAPQMCGLPMDLRAVRDGLIGGLQGTVVRFFELRNVSEYDERGSKSEKIEVAIV